MSSKFRVYGISQEIMDKHAVLSNGSQPTFKILGLKTINFCTVKLLVLHTV